MNRATLLLLLPLLLLSCSLSSERPEASLQQISEANAIEIEQLFPDTLSRAELHSEKYSFSSQEMIRLSPLNDSQFRVTNFVPMDLAAVTITAHFDGISTGIKLLTIDTIRAHSSAIYSYPATDTYEGINGEVVVIDRAKGFPASALTLDFLPSSEKLQMLKDITVAWSLTFHDFAKPDSDSPRSLCPTEESRESRVSWRPVRPAQARLYTLLILNTAYLFSQEEYIQRFLNEPFYKDVDDSTRIVKEEDWFTPDENKNLYYNKVASKSFRLGVTTGGGLGGGSALGISNSTLTKQFRYKWDDSLLTLDYFPSEYYTGPHPLYSHEMGHCFGYGHNSNVCSTGRLGPKGTPEWDKMYGFPSLSTLLHSKYVHYGLLPCSQEEYYLTEDFDYSQPDDDEDYLP